MTDSDPPGIPGEESTEESAITRREAFALLRRVVSEEPTDREVLLDAADAALAAEVRSLLEWEGRGQGLSSGRGSPSPPDPAIRGDGPLVGEQVGSYRILELLGRGGMGAVYLAEQSEPVERRVALKLVGSSTVGRTARLRFQAERQALARLSHPSIAQLYDAGATADGTPWFAMELVDGQPIHRFADANRLDLRQRLELLLAVCEAVAHAHQQGILHRDLKPANILVGSVGARPHPKIIDFGIAKALDRPLVDATLVTGGATLGTPAYMSPEAVSDPERVDTRSDVYSLGVVLYELLVGVRPLGERSDHPLKLLERIVHEEARRPSTRWSTLDRETREVAAEQRGLDPDEVRRTLDGDLDWIVMKAIAKVPRERYGSAAELAADLERMLRDEPVLARPPSTAYLLRKTVARHRGAVTAAALLVAALTAGALGTTVGFLRARAEAREARRAEAVAREVSDLLTGVFRAASPDEPGADRPPEEVTALDLLERGTQRIETELADEPFLAARFALTLGEVHRSLGLQERARELLEDAERAAAAVPDPQQRPVRALRAEILSELAVVSYHQSRHDEARHHIEQAREAGGDAIDPSRRALFEATLLDTSSRLARREGDFERAEAERREANRLLAAAPEPDRNALLSGLNNLAVIYFAQGRWADAEETFRQAVDLAREILPPGHPRTAQAFENLGAAMANQGRLEEAAALYAEALEAKRARLGEDHPALGVSLNNLAMVQDDLGRPAEAEPLHRRALELRRRTLGPEHADTAWSFDNLARTVQALGRPHEALELQEEALRIRRIALGAGHPQIARSLEHLAELARERGDGGEAERRYREALAVRGAAGAGESPEVARTAADLGELLLEGSRSDEAREVLEEALAALGPGSGDGDRELRDRIGALLDAIRGR